MFDCEICKKQNRNTKRVCFLTQEEYEFEIPLITWDGPNPRPSGEIKRELVGVDDFYELLKSRRELPQLKNTSLMEILSRFFRDVCPRSIVNMEDTNMLAMEAFCSEYGCLPYDGGMLDQPNVLIEAFNIIRGARNEYERIRQNEMKRKIEMKNQNPPTTVKK